MEMPDYKLEELIREALKDYRGNEKVVVITTTGGTVDIEDLEEEKLISENDELREQISELEDEVIALEEKISELEDEIEGL